MNLSESFHVTNGVRQGEVLSPYLFSVYLDDLSLEPHNIKAGCYIGEVLLNNLVCWWYLRFVQVHVGCEVCMELFSTAAKLFVLRLRLILYHKMHGYPLADTGYTKSKICFPLQIFGDCISELSDDKDNQRQLRYQYCAADKLRTSLSQSSNRVKMYFFVPSARPCMHHNHGAISVRHACTGCVWPLSTPEEHFFISEKLFFNPSVM